jgi:pimeloyl-ACP methyl ester carboxylesterase
LGAGRERQESPNPFGRFRSFVGGTEQAVSVLNGMFGDLLDERQSPLALPMTFRYGGAELRLDREALAEELADATSAVCVFVPGLMSSDAVWRFPGRAEMTYGSRLAADRNVTSVFLSYNSGRHVSDNGKQLALMLEALATAWPVELGELSLVGHSMGGLVIRSASRYGTVNGHAWVKKLRRVFLLGAPLSGAPLEKVLHLADFTLSTIWNPVTRIVGRALRRRSAGVKDLRFGALVEEDWSGHDPDALRWPHRTPVPLIATADHYLIAGTLTGRSDHPAAQVLGDPVVTCFSATGRTLSAWGAIVATTHMRTLPGVGHLALAHNDDVYQQMLAWWTTP